MSGGYFASPWPCEDGGPERLRNLQQGLAFSCPGWGRDFYWVGIDKLARVFPE